MVSVVLLAIRSGLDQALVLQVWGRELCEQVLLVHSDPMVQDLLRDPCTGQLRFKPPKRLKFSVLTPSAPSQLLCFHLILTPIPSELYALHQLCLT